MNADGSEVRNLSRSPSVDGDPAWSPGGEWVAFVSDRDDDDLAIFVVPADGEGAPRKISSAPEGDYALDWAPVPEG